MSQTAVIYLRVSSPGQVNKGFDPEGYSIPSQRERCQRYAEQLGADVIREYVELGKTGTNINRPALKQLLADLADLKPNFAVFYDLSRVCRDDFDAQWLWREISEKHNCLIQSTVERIDDSSSGRLLYTIMAGVNAHRSRGDAEKVKLGMRRKHATGGTNGKAPIGYLNYGKWFEGREVRTVKVDEERYELIVMAFQMYSTGAYSITQITEILDAAGLRTMMTQKRPAASLSRSAVHHMLGNDYYTGFVTREGVQTRGEHQPIVDPALFERVQEVLKAHSLSGERSRKHENYLKGSVYCGRCGSRLQFTPVSGNGGQYEYFRCFSRHNLRNDCDAAHVRAERVERAVEQAYFDERWLTPEEMANVRNLVIEYGEQQATVAKTEADRAAKRLISLKAEQSRLLQLAYKHLVDDDVLAAEQERIQLERAKVEKWAKAASHTANEFREALDQAQELLRQPAAAYLRATPTERRMFNQAIFHRIYVLNGDVVAALPNRWIRQLEALAERPAEDEDESPNRPEESPFTRALARHEARKHQGLRGSGGLGLHENQMVRPRGLEPPRTNRSTRPSTR
jgi:site-specific DNA recombinase